MRERICKLSLFSVILACVSTLPVDAAVKSKNSNRSYAAGYQAVNYAHNQQEYVNTTAAAVAQLPVMVDDEKLANSIVTGEVGAPSVSDLEACSMIYVNGNFKWGRPEYGINTDPQCIAVVELRDRNSNTILASTTVAAGQSIKCNIDSFPSGSYNMSALSKIELPADAEPTVEDVIAVMNEEQKQNAGLKIAAGAIIAGVAGNLLSKQDTSKENNNKIPLGTGKSQLLGTAAGIAAGAGIMAASSYSGKVAGDTIKSTAVNAASGMIIGNMLAGTGGGDSVIATTKCSVDGVEKDCVVGKYEKREGTFNPESGAFYIVKPDGTGVRRCNQTTSEDFECTPFSDVRLGEFVVKTENEQSKPLNQINKERQGAESFKRWKLDTTKNNDIFIPENTPTAEAGASYYEIESAQILGAAKTAYAVFDTPLNKAFGYKDWKELSSKNPKLYHRYAGGGVGDLIKEDNGEELAPVSDFTPLSRDAEDGALIDLSNEARAKGTIVGTAAGGALGGFAGYQGAQSEVSERWTSAVREYKDSLSSVVCTTGGRFLSEYNDYAEIPALKTNK